MTEPTSCWVFGYGSLCWNPGFSYKDSVIGHITGYSRRFWQGNVTHRGTNSKPGRVATLVEDKTGVVWGRAFLVTGDEALPYLDTRECRLGGYTTVEVIFNPVDSRLPSFATLLYLATPDNQHWLGEASYQEIAHQILTSCGASGHNVEYLLRLADFMHDQIPWAEDEHLFKLEALVREGLQRRTMEAVASGQFASRVTSKKLRCLSI